MNKSIASGLAGGTEIGPHPMALRATRWHARVRAHRICRSRAMAAGARGRNVITLQRQACDGFGSSPLGRTACPIHRAPDLFEESDDVIRLRLLSNVSAAKDGVLSVRPSSCMATKAAPRSRTRFLLRQGVKVFRNVLTRAMFAASLLLAPRCLHATESRSSAAAPVLTRREVGAPAKKLVHRLVYLRHHGCALEAAGLRRARRRHRRDLHRDRHPSEGQPGRRGQSGRPGSCADWCRRQGRRAIARPVDDGHVQGGVAEGEVGVVCEPGVGGDVGHLFRGALQRMGIAAAMNPKIVYGCRGRK